MVTELYDTQRSTRVKVLSGLTIPVKLRFNAFGDVGPRTAPPVLTSKRTPSSDTTDNHKHHANYLKYFDDWWVWSMRNILPKDTPNPQSDQQLANRVLQPGPDYTDVTELKVMHHHPSLIAGDEERTATMGGNFSHEHDGGHCIPIPHSRQIARIHPLQEVRFLEVGAAALLQTGTRSLLCQLHCFLIMLTSVFTVALMVCSYWLLSLSLC